MFINSGTLDNQGYELEIEAIPVQTNLWEWRIRFTAGHTKDILDRSDADQQTLEHFTNGSAIVDRFPISAFWSFPFIRIIPDKRKSPIRHDGSTQWSITKSP